MIQIDSPIEVGASSDWALGAGASKVAAVATNDGDTSFLSAYSGGRVNTQLFIFPPLVGITDPVTAASLSLIARKGINGSGGQSLFFLWNSVVAGTNQWANLPTDYTYVGLPYSAGTPAVAATNGQHGFYMSAAGGPSGGTEIWATMFFRSVTFEFTAVDSEGFSYLVGQWIVAALGAGLMFREMPKIAAFLRRNGLLLEPREYAEAFRRIRALTFPQHFVLLDVKG